MSTLILVNALLAVAACLSFALSGLNKRMPLLTAKSEHQFNSAFLPIIFLILLGVNALPDRPFLETRFKREMSSSVGEAFSSIKPAPTKTLLVKEDHPLGIDYQKIFVSLFILAGILSLLMLTRDMLRLRRILKESYKIKGARRLAIYVNDSIKVPFSFSFGLTAYVLLPSPMCSDRQNFKLAILHELQHIRQGDTMSVWLMLVLRFFTALNPFYYLWSRHFSTLQEFACDETLLGQKKVSWQAYARCLFEVAKSARGDEGGLACATGLAFMTDGITLKRRIEKMKTRTQAWNSGVVCGVLALVGVVALTGVALASHEATSDRTITMKEALDLVLSDQKSSEFPLTLNESVLKELNHFLGTNAARKHTRDGLERMKKYKSVIDGKIAEHQVPAELAAVPLVESGYQNLRQDDVPSQHGAGLWMFIKPTAIRYGMKVNEEIDERLDVEKETDAAMRYLKSNKEAFKDWQLSLLAYNSGESAVQKAIDKTGSKDAWKLLKAGLKTDQGYLPKVMAAVIIMKHPKVLE